MKKVTAFALALVLCLGLLAGCGGNNAQPSSPAPSHEYRCTPPGGPPPPPALKRGKKKV